MSFEVKLGNRNAVVQLLYRENNRIGVSVDGHIYDLDLLMVEEGIYSVIYGHKSYNVELIRNSSAKKYTVNTYKSSYDVEIIDAESKYLRSRDKSRLAFDAQTIVSPMPGKVVKIMVEEGEDVEEGQTVIVLSAMKMESEFKAGKSAKILKVHVNEGDAVDGQEVLITLE